MVVSFFKALFCFKKEITLGIFFITLGRGKFLLCVIELNLVTNFSSRLKQLNGTLLLVGSGGKFDYLLIM